LQQDVRRRGAASKIRQGSMYTGHERRILAARTTEPFVALCYTVTEQTEAGRKLIFSRYAFTEIGAKQVIIWYPRIFGSI
jgi:hypothetical protein